MKARKQTLQSAASLSLVSSFFLHSVRAASSVESAFSLASPSGLVSAFCSFFSSAGVSLGASLYHLAAEGCILRTAIGVIKVCGRDRGFWATERVVERSALEGIVRACRSILNGFEYYCMASWCDVGRRKIFFSFFLSERNRMMG